MRIVAIDAGYICAALKETFAVAERRHLIREKQIVRNGIGLVRESGMTLGAHGHAVRPREFFRGDQAVSRTGSSLHGCDVILRRAVATLAANAALLARSGRIRRTVTGQAFLFERGAQGSPKGISKGRGLRGIEARGEHELLARAVVLIGVTALNECRPRERDTVQLLDSLQETEAIPFAANHCFHRKRQARAARERAGVFEPACGATDLVCRS